MCCSINEHCECIRYVCADAILCALSCCETGGEEVRCMIVKTPVCVLYTVVLSVIADSKPYPSGRLFAVLPSLLPDLKNSFLPSSIKYVPFNELSYKSWSSQYNSSFSFFDHSIRINLSLVNKVAGLLWPSKLSVSSNQLSYESSFNQYVNYLFTSLLSCS